MIKWECQSCGYIYNPEKGDIDHEIQPRTPFFLLPKDWICPVCSAKKKAFLKKLNQEENE